MPELPDVVVYCESLAERVVGRPLERLEIVNPFVLRTAVPPADSVQGRVVRAVRRVGKRVVLQLDGDLFVVLHLMIAGRLRWLPAGGPARGGARKPPPKATLARLVFTTGTVLFTEAGTKRRASIHIVEGEAALAKLDAGGLDVATATPQEFARRLTADNHTLKRALTDPRILSGIGNAYSDEILHRARLSPFLQTGRLDAGTIERLRVAILEVVDEWTVRLRAAAAATASGFPEEVTAFHPRMAVHGRFGQPCPVCGAPVQRIVYADNETNYCARCQTGGTILADRALSRLLKASWPRSLDDL